jgi:periplasmic divalent cation tolerance protein
MSDSEFVFVYSTFPDEASAKRVGEALVTACLAACVNIYPPMHSIYEWRGKLESGPEIAAFIKTRRSKVEQVIAAARPLHPYTVPCFLVLPIAGGNEDYLAWARAQTEGKAPA